MQILDGWNYIAQKMTGTTSIIINNSISMQRDCAQPVFLEGMERQSCHYCSQLFTLWVYYPKSRGETKASSTAILQNLTLPSLQIDSHILPLVPEALKVKTCKWSWILPWRLSISHLWSSLQRFHSWEVLEVAWHLALVSGIQTPHPPFLFSGVRSLLSDPQCPRTLIGETISWRGCSENTWLWQLSTLCRVGTQEWLIPFPCLVPPKWRIIKIFGPIC